MLWYKSFLETRWRFLIGLAVLVLSVLGTVFAYPRVVRLLPLVPAMVTAVVESGLSRPAELAKLRETRCDAVLMGEVLVTSADPSATLATLAAAARGL